MNKKCTLIFYAASVLILSCSPAIFAMDFSSKSNENKFSASSTCLSSAPNSSLPASCLGSPEIATADLHLLRHDTSSLISMLPNDLVVMISSFADDTGVTAHAIDQANNIQDLIENPCIKRKLSFNQFFIRQMMCKKFEDEINKQIKIGDKSYFPIFLAIEKESIGALQLLLAANAAVNLATSQGETPLYIAAQNGHSEVVQTLLKAGAQINQAEKYGETPLWAAASKGHSQTVQTLLAANAAVNQPAVDGSTPLFVAAYNRHSQVVQILLAANAKVDPTLKDDGRTPLHTAVSNGHTQVVQMLITANAQVNLSTNDGKTPLYAAAVRGVSEIVQILLAAGADINQTFYNRTPLDIAQRYKRDTIVTLIKSHQDSLRSQSGLFD